MGSLLGRSRACTDVTAETYGESVALESDAVRGVEHWPGGCELIRRPASRGGRDKAEETRMRSVSAETYR